ncbi:MAG: hypothetical protein RR477_07025 [Raoultibacter sp.]
MATYSVFYTAGFLQQMAEVSGVAQTKIEHTIELLKTTPGIGALYRPAYAAAMPPMPCQWTAVPFAHFALYYIVDETAKTVTLYYLDNTKRNPLTRFTDTR